MVKGLTNRLMVDHQCKSCDFLSPALKAIPPCDAWSARKGKRICTSTHSIAVATAMGRYSPMGRRKTDEDSALRTLLC